MASNVLFSFETLLFEDIAMLTSTMNEKAAQFCLGIILSIAIFFGILGNIVSCCVWTKGRRCRKLPGGIYLRALAISDTIALCLPATNEAVKLLTQHDPRDFNLFFCKLENVGRHFGLLVSSWIIVCFSIERTVALFKPRQTAIWTNRKTTMAIVTGIFVFNFLLNLPYGFVYYLMNVIDKPQWTYSLNTTFRPDTNVTYNTDVNFVANFTSNTTICASNPASVFAYLNWYHLWFMDFVLIFVAPFILITLSNITVLTLIIAHKTLKNRGSMKLAVTSRAIAVSVSHCLTTGPYSILVLIPNFSDGDSDVKSFIASVSVVLAYMNHSLNYVLYSVFGTDFRRDCLELVWKKSSADQHTEATNATELRTRRTDDKLTSLLVDQEISPIIS